jgi:hypothetical protein
VQDLGRHRLAPAALEQRLRERRRTHERVPSSAGGWAISAGWDAGAAGASAARALGDVAMRAPDPDPAHADAAPPRGIHGFLNPLFADETREFVARLKVKYGLDGAGAMGAGAPSTLGEALASPRTPRPLLGGAAASAGWAGPAPGGAPLAGGCGGGCRCRCGEALAELGELRAAVREARAEAAALRAEVDAYAASSAALAASGAAAAARALCACGGGGAGGGGGGGGGGGTGGVV